MALGLRTRRALGVVAIGGIVTIACTDEALQPVKDAPAFDFANAGDTRPGDGLLEHEQLEVCKLGSDADFTIDVVNNLSNGSTDNVSYDVSVADGDCLLVWESGGAPVDEVTVTEHVPAGYTASWEMEQLAGANFPSDPGATVTTTSGMGNVATGLVAGDPQHLGAIVTFTNEPIDMTPGRMTGGGAQIRIDEVRITRGFTIHCDITLSNNIEVNWTGGNKWHLDKPITAATCIDDPAVDPVPPDAPFDTFIGQAWGRLNGVDGSYIEFVFVDDGEPGTTDRASIDIWAPGANPSVDLPVLSVSGLLDHGNLQAHYDQPHK